MDILIPILVFGAAAAAGPLLWLSMTRPTIALTALLIVTFLIPNELSIKIGDLPRIGPLRVAVAVFLLGLLLRTLLRGQPILVPRGALGGMVIANLVVLMLSALFSINFLASAYHLLDQLIVVLLFFLMWQQSRNDEAFSCIKLGIYLGSAAVCVFALVELTLGFTITPFLDASINAERLGFSRIRSTFFHPIALGTFIDLVFPFLLADLIRARRSRLRLGTLAAALILVQLMTISRVCWIVMVAETLFVVTFAGQLTPRKVTRVYLAFLGCFAAGISAYLLIPAVQELFAPFLRIGSAEEASSEYYRVALTRAVIDSLQGFRWLVGFGPGTFQLAGIQSDYAGDAHILDAPDLHYVRVLADSGLLGLGSFVALLVATLSTGIRTARSSNPDVSLDGLAALASIIGFVLINLTVSMFYTLPLALLFWLAVARAAALRKPSTGKNPMISASAGPATSPRQRSQDRRLSEGFGG